MILMAPHQRTGRDHQGVLVSRGWTPSNEICEPTTSHWTKQSTWPRTVLCGGWCLRMALCTPSGACQRRRRPIVSWCEKWMSSGRYTQSNSAGGSTGTLQMPIGVYQMGSQWRHLDMIELSVCSSDAALCRVTLTTCYRYHIRWICVACDWQ